MMINPTHGMVLAAGLGRRMLPITDDIPKSLIPVAGKTLIDRVLDQLQLSTIRSVTVNLHYLGHMIEEHLASRAEPHITFSWETDLLLETGGGVKAALPSLGDSPFYVVNADIAWQDGSQPALSRLAEFWCRDTMDALLLLHPVAQATGYDGVGDYRRYENGTVRRRRDDLVAPFVFTGIQLLHPRLFANAPKGPFPLTRLYDEAEEAGRLYGVVHDGAWHHIGTPAGLAEAETFLDEMRPLSEEFDGG